MNRLNRIGLMWMIVSVFLLVLHFVPLDRFDSGVYSIIAVFVFGVLLVIKTRSDSE